MTWTPVPKERRYGEPVLTVYGQRGGTHIFNGNIAAHEMLPELVVLLRNGDQLALRAPNKNDLPWTIRKAGHRKNQVYVSCGRLGEVGQRFRVVPKDDLFLLEPITGDGGKHDE